jgi:hypothetical protein
MTQEELVSALMGAGGPKSPGLSKGLDAAFAVPPQQLQRMAGDVVPLPITPGPMAGPTLPNGQLPMSGLKSLQPNVSLMPLSVHEKYFENLLRRLKNK